MTLLAAAAEPSWGGEMESPFSAGRSWSR